MLGKNRQEKNWELMPALLELISPMLRNNEVRLQLPNIIAASLRKFRDDPSISPNLRFHHINLQQGYFEELCSTDILILAYDPKTYDFRVSGIAEEATVAGIPFLISSGTLTANTYRDTGICREFDINDAADLAENIRVMVNNYKQYSESATKFSVSARKSHSGTTFLSTLSDITEGKIK